MSIAQSPLKRSRDTETPISDKQAKFTFTETFVFGEYNTDPDSAENVCVLISSSFVPDLHKLMMRSVCRAWVPVLKETKPICKHLGVYWRVIYDLPVNDKDLVGLVKWCAWHTKNMLQCTAKALNQLTIQGVEIDPSGGWGDEVHDVPIETLVRAALIPQKNTRKQQRLAVIHRCMCEHTSSGYCAEHECKMESTESLSAFAANNVFAVRIHSVAKVDKIRIPNYPAIEGTCRRHLILMAAANAGRTEMVAYLMGIGYRFWGDTIFTMPISLDKDMRELLSSKWHDLDREKKDGYKLLAYIQSGQVEKVRAKLNNWVPTEYAGLKDMFVAGIQSGNLDMLQVLWNYSTPKDDPSIIRHDIAGAIAFCCHDMAHPGRSRYKFKESRVSLCSMISHLQEMIGWNQGRLCIDFQLYVIIQRALCYDAFKALVDFDIVIFKECYDGMMASWEAAQLTELQLRIKVGSVKVE